MTLNWSRSLVLKCDPRSGDIAIRADHFMIEARCEAAGSRRKRLQDAIRRIECA
jgi:hypothetical protein